eukprot:SAG31_NODE_1956_length_6817_cov_10.363501_3_plen_83_part_00
MATSFLGGLFSGRREGQRQSGTSEALEASRRLQQKLQKLLDEAHAACDEVDGGNNDKINFRNRLSEAAISLEKSLDVRCKRL